MLKYILSRVINIIVLAFGVLFIVFMLVHITGDPASLIAPRQSSPEDIEKLREELGFNRPVLVQFYDFIKGALVGDFGPSFRYGEPAMKLVLERLPASIELAVVSLLMSMVIGVSFGILGGSNPNTPVDLVARGVGLMGQTIPRFWFGLILIIVFAVKLGWFPTFGRETFMFWGIRLPTKSVVLPAISLSLLTTGQLVRFTRSAVMEIKNEDYIRTAHSKGLPRFIIYTRHILHNAAIPLISIIGVQFGYLLSGSIYIETIFAWPGLGNLLAESVGMRDFFLVQAVAFFTSLVVIAMHLVTDISYALVDPRIRYK